MSAGDFVVPQYRAPRSYDSVPLMFEHLGQRKTPIVADNSWRWQAQPETLMDVRKSILTMAAPSKMDDFASKYTEVQVQASAAMDVITGGSSGDQAAAANPAAASGTTPAAATTPAPTTTNPSFDDALKRFEQTQQEYRAFFEQMKPTQAIVADTLQNEQQAALTKQYELDKNVVIQAFTKSEKSFEDFVRQEFQFDPEKLTQEQIQRFRAHWDIVNKGIAQERTKALETLQKLDTNFRSQLGALLEYAQKNNTALSPTEINEVRDVYARAAACDPAFSQAFEKFSALQASMAQDLQKQQRMTASQREEQFKRSMAFQEQANSTVKLALQDRDENKRLLEAERERARQLEERLAQMNKKGAFGPSNGYQTSGNTSSYAPSATPVAVNLTASSPMLKINPDDPLALKVCKSYGILPRNETAAVAITSHIADRQRMRTPLPTRQDILAIEKFWGDCQQYRSNHEADDPTLRKVRDEQMGLYGGNAASVY